MDSKISSNTITVRGIPIPIDDVIAKELEYGAQLFDESTFKTLEQQVACANVILVLDKALRQWQEQNNTRRLPEYLDVGDRSWFYIPVDLFPPEAGITMMRTKARPAGLVAWFRTKRNFAVKRNYH